MNVPKNLPEFEKKWIELVQTHKSQLASCPYQTYNICLAAVKFDGFALKYVETQTPELCELAVESNIYAFSFIKNKSYEMCKKYVSYLPSLIHYVDEKMITEELVDIVIKEDATSIRFLPSVSAELWLRSLNENEKVFNFLPKEFSGKTKEESFALLEKEILKNKVLNLNND